MSEYKLRFPWTSSPVTELCSNTESQWGWKETFCRAEVRRDGGDGNQSRRKAESMRTRCCRNKPELQTHLPTHLPRASRLASTSKCSWEWCPSASSEARFISNKVSQDDYRISHSLSYKATYMQFWVFCLFAFSYPYPSTHLHKRHKLKVKYIRHCCILQ